MHMAHTYFILPACESVLLMQWYKSIATSAIVARYPTYITLCNK